MLGIDLREGSGEKDPEMLLAVSVAIIETYRVNA
jgi:hypothetical protein